MSSSSSLLSSLAAKLRQNYNGFDRLEFSNTNNNTLQGEPNINTTLWNDFIDSIPCNQTIHYVSIKKGNAFIENLSREQFQRVLQSLSQLPKLRELSVVVDKEILMDISTLAVLIKESKSLHKLRLCGLSFVGTIQKNYFEGSSSSSSSLSEINLMRCRFLNNSNSDRICLDPLFISLSKMITLKRVIIDLKHNNNNNSQLCTSTTTTTREGIQSLCSSQYIQCLTLGGFEFTNEDITILSTSIQTNTALKEFALCDCYGIHLTSFHCAISLSSMLQKNATLQRLELCGMTHVIDDTTCYSIANALSYSNTTLKRLDLQDNENITKHGYMALTSMLEHNYSLEHLGTDDIKDLEKKEQQQLEEKVDRYLQMNRAGTRRRRALEKDTPTSNKKNTNSSGGSLGLHNYIKFRDFPEDSKSAVMVDSSSPMNKKRTWDVIEELSTLVGRGQIC